MHRASGVGLLQGREPLLDTKRKPAGLYPAESGRKEMRYTVGYCLYPHGKDDSIETPMRIILCDGIAAAEINRHLVLTQLNKDRPLSTPVYHLCTFLNYLDANDISVIDATMDMIYSFLTDLYIDGLPFAGDGMPRSYTTICKYVDALSKLYDSLAIRGYMLDSSLYTSSQKMMLFSETKHPRRSGHIVKKAEHLTVVHQLCKLFSPNQNDMPTLTYATIPALKIQWVMVTIPSMTKPNILPIS